MKDKEKTIRTCLYFLIATSLLKYSAIGAKAYFSYKAEKEAQSYENVVEVFDEGEHIVSVPIQGAFKNQQQYDYHDGYKVVDIEKDFILYVNEEPVKCIGYQDNNNETHFINFGEPVEFENEQTNSKTYKLVPQEQTTTEE